MVFVIIGDLVRDDILDRGSGIREKSQGFEPVLSITKRKDADIERQFAFGIPCAESHK